MTGGWGDGRALADATSSATWWLELGVASLFYGLGEEAGWRGFLLPRLMQRGSALVATLAVAVVWAAWHAPFFAYRFDFSGPSTVVGFFVAMAAGALWLTFLYLSTGGSVLAVAAWHAVWNVANLIAAEMSDLVLGVLNGAMIVLGFGVLLVVGKRLRWEDAPPSRLQRER
jgi:membrane protease YdiL (CAAX protease family)